MGMTSRFRPRWAQWRKMMSDLHRLAQASTVSARLADFELGCGSELEFNVYGYSVALSFLLYSSIAIEGRFEGN